MSVYGSVRINECLQQCGSASMSASCYVYLPRLRTT
eukprot:SAG11_NODE_14901_length_595_cov_1.687500_2_plen_35_part_01